MKATFKGKVLRLLRGDSETQIEVNLKGKVDTRLVTAQESSLTAVLTIKNIVADQLKVGANFVFAVTDEEQEDV